MTTRMSIDQAAAALGVSRPTVRRRLRNGELAGSQVSTPQGFRWEVIIDLPSDSSPGESSTPQAQPPPEETARLRDEHIADLRRRVEDQAREISELHRLLAQAQQQSQHLLTDSSRGESIESRPTPQTQNDAAPEWPEQRSWWQRLVFG